MARDLYIDTDSRQFVEGFNNAAIKIQGPYYKGDTETLNLYFLQRTGLIGTPYSYLDKSSSTAKLSWGTPGQSTLLSITGVTTKNNAITASVTRAQLATSQQNEIQKIVFSEIAVNGYYSFGVPDYGITAGFNRNHDNVTEFTNNSYSRIQSNQVLTFTGVTGANSDAAANVGVTSGIFVANNYGRSFDFGTIGFAPYNAIITKVGTSVGLKVKEVGGEIHVWGDYPSNPGQGWSPVLGDAFTFSNTNGIRGITAGTTYYISEVRPNNTTSSLLDYKISSSFVSSNILGWIRAWSAESGFTGDYYAVTGLLNNALVLRPGDGYKVTGEIIGTPPQIKFRFYQIIDLSGVNLNTSYNIKDSGNSSYSYSRYIYLDDDTKVTGITSAASGIDNNVITHLSGIVSDNVVYSFNVGFQASRELSYNADTTEMATKLAEIPVIAGTTGLNVIKNLSGDILVSFGGKNAFMGMPILSIESHMTSAPGLTATVGITSAAITTLLSGTTSSPVTLEVELTTSGNKLTAAQGDATIAVALSH